MTRVKICGLTLERDVRTAAHLGAWACGFVLSESPRRIEVSRAAQLTPLTGRALAVAVVTTEDAEWIAAAVAAGGFGAVQLCAGADGPTVSDVRAAAGDRALRPLVIAAQDAADARSADLLLFDVRTEDAYGGTGRTLDWPALASQRLPRERLVLAGGLRPANVDLAIKLLGPLAVDTSSGVERAPGIKDPRLMSAFFGAVAGADYSGGTPA